MANKGKGSGMILLLIIAAVAFFMFNSSDSGSVGGADSKDNALQMFFADKNKQPVGKDQFESISSQSTVSFNEGATVFSKSEIFFMRYNLKVVNSGAVTKTVKLKDVKILDANNNVIEQTIVTGAFSCILNKDAVLAPSASKVWSTNPDDATSGCGSNAWIPTTLFENYPQPLKIVATVSATFNLFGIKRTADVDYPLQVYVTATNLSEAGIGVSLGEGANASMGLTECNASQTRLCPLQTGVCSGSQDVCTNNLWAGCFYSDYNANYLSGSEANGNWLVTCKDGLDNDCNGQTDRALPNGTCAAGAGLCDPACPTAVVNFRTNANFNTAENYTLLKTNTIYISVLKNSGDNVLTSYEYSTTQSVVSQTTCDAKLAGTGQTAQTPAGKYHVFTSYSGGYEKAEIYYDTDGNTLNGCYDMIFYNTGTAGRCIPGHAGYPECIQKFPVPAYYTAKQETRVSY